MDTNMSDNEYYCPECERIIRADETHIDKGTGKPAHQVHDGKVSVSHLLVTPEDAGP